MENKNENRAPVARTNEKEEKERAAVYKDAAYHLAMSVAGLGCLASPLERAKAMRHLSRVRRLTFDLADRLLLESDAKWRARD